MNENKKLDPGSAAQSPRDPVDGQVKSNPEGGRPRPGTEAEEGPRPGSKEADLTGGTSVLGEEA
jgi:hypothetical protein